MSETYTPAGNVGSSFQRATVGEAATGTHGQEFMRDDITKMADKIRFLSDAGFPTVSKIQFPAVQVPDADVNALDDYEEGTFTPTLKLGGATTGITYSVQLGTYTKIGRLVFCSIRLVLTSKGSAVGAATITGLPFTPAADASATCGIATVLTAAGAVHGNVDATVALINLFYATATGSANLSDTQLSNITTLFVSVVYSA